MNSTVSNLPEELQELYLKENWKTLIEKMIETKSNFAPSQFHYNLGSIYAKKSEFAIARYHLEKSLKLVGYNGKIKNNLSYVVQKLEQPTLWDRSSGIGKVDSMFEHVNPWLIGVPFALIAMIIYMRLKNAKVYYWLSAYVFNFIIFALIYWHIDGLRFAIALKDAPLREGPSKLFNSVGEIKAGAKIILGKHDNGYWYIKEPIDYRGWAKADELGIY